MTATEISTRIDRKACALRAVADASESMTAAKRDYEVIRSRYTLEGLEDSNDKQRQADLAKKTEAKREAVTQAEKGLHQAQLELDIASLRVQEATLLLRLALQTT